MGAHLQDFLVVSKMPFIIRPTLILCHEAQFGTFNRTKTEKY